MGVRVTGWGTALPEKVVTNAELAAYLDTSDEWIVERTGIRERRIGGSTSALGLDAALEALAHAGRAPTDIDLVLLATCTPDQQIPGTAATIQDELGVRGGAMDLNAACAGFVYGLVTAAGLLATGLRRVLLVGAETLSRSTDWEDRNTAVLFADGAGAVVVEATVDDGDLLGWDLGSDGSARHLLYADLGGVLHMDGREVFRRAVRATVETAQASMERAGVAADDIALFVPHQANLRIIEAAATRLGIPMARTAVTIDRTGNTSAASIPLAVVDAARAGRLARGDLVLMAGFGAGMSWASAVLRWDGVA